MYDYRRFATKELGKDFFMPSYPAPSLRLVGHSSFLVRSASAIRVLIDPYGNPRDGTERWFERPFHQILTDILIVTHDHFDHSAEDRVVARERIGKRATLTLDDVTVRTIPDRHAGLDDASNLVALVETGGVRFCHLGDNRSDIPGDLVDTCRPVDVLAVPVDDTHHLMSFADVDRLIDALDPRVVVPMHYRQPGISAPSTPLGGCDAWLAARRNVRRIGGEVAITQSGLPEKREVWALEPVPGPSTGPVMFSGVARAPG